MTVILAGTMRFPPEHAEALRPHLADAMAGTRKEEGNLDYSFAFDASEPGLLRLFEKWTDAEKLVPHGKTEHIARFRQACQDFGVGGWDIKTYEIASEK